MFLDGICFHDLAGCHSIVALLISRGIIIPKGPYIAKYSACGDYELVPLGRIRFIHNGISLAIINLSQVVFGLSYLQSHLFCNKLVFFSSSSSWTPLKLDTN